LSAQSLTITSKVGFQTKCFIINFELTKQGIVKFVFVIVDIEL